VPQRRYSASRQFVVYCDDRDVRQRVTMFAEETKDHVLRALGEKDTWKRPIVIQLVPARTSIPGQNPLTFSVIGSEQGIKIQIDVILGGPLPATPLQSEVIRALLLELAYRGRNGLRGGHHYNEPPAWLIEGIAYSIRQQSMGVNADLFKTLIDVNRVPSINEFLSTSCPVSDPASLALYRAYAYSLLRILQDLPSGRNCLSKFVEDIPVRSGNPVSDLITHFPPLVASSDSLEKWWLLSMARLSATNEYEGLSAEETEKELNKLMTIKVRRNGENVPAEFELGDYKQYLALYGGKARISERQQDFLRLEARANPLYRSILAEYSDIAFQISRGKTRNIPGRLKKVREYRLAMLKRMDAIADYLNWMEATQFGTKSDSFEEILRFAREPLLPREARNDPISLYLDKVEKQLR
jgi:hypothetical protein